VILKRIAHRLIGGAALLLLLAQGGLMMAQAQEIAYGAGITGAVTAAEGAVYTFAGRAGDVVTVLAFGLESRFTPHLLLGAPDGSDLAETGSGRLVYYLVEDGLYTLIASGGDESAGTFALRLDGEAAIDTTNSLMPEATFEIPISDTAARVFRIDAHPEVPYPLGVNASVPFRAVLGGQAGVIASVEQGYAGVQFAFHL
jgi:hypothetical protein